MTIPVVDELEDPFAEEASEQSAVSWAAVFAGAAAAAATSILLLALGAGLGLSSVSPWTYAGVSATTFAVGAAIFLIVVHWLSSAVGGYIAGRLRTKWTGVHTDEVFFRDTAHGFLAWAVAAIVTTALLTGAASSIAGGSRTGARGAGDDTRSTAAADPTAYYADYLFRSTRAEPAGGAETRAEARRILAMGGASGNLTSADRAYLAQLVAARTGLSQPDADKRVDDVVAQAKTSADNARSAAAKLSFYTFFSMLIGAFCASAAGALGGRLRDEY